MKRFLEWIGIKQKIQEKAAIPPFFKEGDVWWCGLGENIGIEINGKSEAFSRPVVVYKKLSREGFMAIPMSTRQKEGSWYVSVSFQGKDVTLNIGQVRVTSVYRMYSKIGELDNSDMSSLSEKFLLLYTR